MLAADLAYGSSVGHLLLLPILIHLKVVVGSVALVANSFTLQVMHRARGKLFWGYNPGCGYLRLLDRVGFW